MTSLQSKADHSPVSISSASFTITGATTTHTDQKVKNILIINILQALRLHAISDSLNGKHFPMELHVVFFRQEYKSMKQAMLNSDGLVVMA
jgi:carbonic anhydrase